MFISKTRHDNVCNEYEQKIFELTNQLNRLDFSQDGNGGPYKRILECREVAKVAATLSPQLASQLLSSLSFIDCWMNGLIPLMTANMCAKQKERWESTLKELPAREIYVEAINTILSHGSYQPDSRIGVSALPRSDTSDPSSR